VTPTRIALPAALDRARTRTDDLFRLVRPEALYDRSIPERHRILFYIGHLEAFDWNLVSRALDLPSFHPSFDRLFAFGIDPPPGELPSDKPSDWPALAEVERYNHRVRDEIDQRRGELSEQLLHVAVEHRLMHAETFAYILHQVSYERKVSDGEGVWLTDAPAHQPAMIDVPAGEAVLGLDPGERFGWDNEFRKRRVEVPAFSISRHKVTNGDYLEYVRQGAVPPFFWSERSGRWVYRGMFAEIPLPLDWPVYVTQRQAAEYARWRGKSLPSEPQFHRAAAMERGTSEIPDGNFDFRRWDPVPVTAGQAPGVPNQMAGNGWEWTSTIFSPFEGFKPFSFYPNYSEPFFDGQHYVLKGASPRTAACFLRPSFRNWFRPEYPYIYSTFRMVEN
jgi:formylglycine-generating enzyme required for sulfatase activity